MQLNVRVMKVDEVHLVVDYFLKSDREFLMALGVDPEKLPSSTKWLEILRDDFQRPLRERKFFYVLWELDGTPVGHSHINDIVYGQEAFMHLHLWQSKNRRCGMGTMFVRKSVEIYFEKFELKVLFCQPYALNEAPHKTLSKVGFEFVETYETVPSWVNFRQSVTKWRLTRERLSATCAQFRSISSERPST